MPSTDKSPEDRYSSGQQIQKRAGQLLEALLDHAEQVRRFGNDIEKADIKVTLPNSRSNRSGIKFKVKRNFLAKLSGIRTENLTAKESKQIYDKVRNVVDCLKKFGIISDYFPQKIAWDLILPDRDKGKLLKEFSDACNNWEAEKVAKSAKAPWSEIRNYAPSEFEALDQKFFDVQGQRGESRILKLRTATWSLIIQGNYIERDQQGEALEIARQLAKLPEISLLLIRGEPGAGKTALMRWLTYELFRCGCLILEKKAQDEDPGWLEQLREFSEQIGEKHFYVIADDLFRDESILDELEQSQLPFPFTLIGTTRLNEDQHESLEGWGYQIKILDVKRPSKAEKKRILAKVYQEPEVQARLKNLVAADKKRLMNAPAMLVLMLQLSEGKAFKQIIADIIRRDLPSTEKRPVYQVFCVICSFSQYGIAVPQEVVPLCIRNYPIETIQDVVDRAEIVELAGLVETINKSGHKHLQTIHELVAKTAMEPYKYRSNDNPPYPCRSLERHLKSIMAQADAIPAAYKAWISYALRLLAINGEADFVRQLVCEFSDQIQFLQHQIGITAWFSWAEVYRIVGLLNEHNQCTSIILSSQPKNSSEWIDWLSLLEKRGTKQQKQESLIQLATWLQDYPEDSHLYRRFFQLIERYYKTHEQKQKAIDMTGALLEKHQKRRYVQTSYLKLVEDFGITIQKQKAIELTDAWLQQYPNDWALLIKHLTLVEKEGTPEQRQKTIDQTATWLQQHPDEQQVRTKYLTLLEKYGTEQQRKEVIDQTASWLEEHQDDRFVRTKYLTLLEKHGTEQQRKNAINRTAAWLEEHQDDRLVRPKYLMIVEKCGTSEQKHRAIDQTADWLPNHIDNLDIRQRYFQLVEEHGTSKHEQQANRISARLKEHSDMQKQKEIEQYAAWMQEHPEDQAVRKEYLTQVERCGTQRQKEIAIDQIIIRQQASLDSWAIRFKGIEIIEKYGTSQQKQGAIEQVAVWLQDNPVKYLTQVKKYGTLEQKQKAIELITPWIAQCLGHLDGCKSYFGLLDKYSTPKQKQEVVQFINNWIQEHSDNRYVRSEYLLFIKNISEDITDIYSVISQQWQWIRKQQKVDINIWKAFLKFLYKYENIKPEVTHKAVNIALEQYPEEETVIYLIFESFQNYLSYDKRFKIATLISSCKLHDKNARNFILSANFFRDNGDLSIAEELYEKVLKLESYLYNRKLCKLSEGLRRNVMFASSNYVRLLLITNQPDQAISYIQPIIATNPKYSVYHWLMAQCYQVKGASFYEQVIHSLKKAIEFDNKKAGFFWYQLGCFYANTLQKKTEARTCFEKSVAEKINLPACIEMAELEVEESNIEGAKEWLEKGLALVESTYTEKEMREKLEPRIQALQACFIETIVSQSSKAS